MSLLKYNKEKKIHTRDIKIATFAHDEDHIIVEGELNDNRIIPNFSLAGEMNPPGNIHHMFIRLLIEIESIRIVQVEVEMPGIPHQECPETIPNFGTMPSWPGEPMAGRSGSGSWAAALILFTTMRAAMKR